MRISIPIDEIAVGILSWGLGCLSFISFTSKPKVIVNLISLSGQAEKTKDLALRYLVWARLMNPIHFMGVDCSHAPTGDTSAPPPNDASPEVLVTESVCEITTSI